jgi:hypothetical protein
LLGNTGLFLMKLRKYYQAGAGYLKEKAVRLKEKIYIMRSAKQRKVDIFQYSL